MATDATFDNQLQALATATANFANDKDAQIKNTIITALGGSTQAPSGELLDPQLACDSYGNVTFLGNGKCDSVSIASWGLSHDMLVYLDSDGTYRKDWVIANVQN